MLDPFMGSGWIAETCEALGMAYLGFEIEPKYIGDIAKRTEKGVMVRKKKARQVKLEFTKRKEGL